MQQNNFLSLSLLNPKEKLIVFIIACTLIILSFNHTTAQQGEYFLMDTSEKLLASLNCVTEMKSLASVATSSHIPVISGAAESISKILDKIFGYLMLTNILVLIQIVLMQLCQLTIIKLCAIGTLFLGFFKKTHKIGLRWLVVFLLINPGMSLYLSSLKHISHHTQIKTLDILHNDLKETKNEFQKKHILRINHEEQLKKENLLEKVAHALIHPISSIAEHIINDFKFFTEFTKKAGFDLIKKSMHVLVANIILFFLLPLLYFYIFLIALKKLFFFPLDKEHLLDIIDKFNSKE